MFFKKKIFTGKVVKKHYLVFFVPFLGAHYSERQKQIVYTMAEYCCQVCMLSVPEDQTSAILFNKKIFKGKVGENTSGLSNFFSKLDFFFIKWIQ